MGAIPRVPLPSDDAFRRAAARVSLAWCLVALVGLPFALASGWRPLAVAAEVGIALCAVVAVQAFALRRGSAWALLMLATVHVTTVLLGVSAAHTLRPDAAHQLISWTNSGVGGALAIAYGARWGLAAFGIDVTAALLAEALAGGAMVGGVDTAIGPFTYVLGAGLVRWAGLRGDAAIERALTAKEAAEGALRVADQRWTAARAVQRELHDTVLATLTLLAHRGAGVPPESVVRASARDAERLRRGALGTALPGADPDAAPTSGGADPSGGSGVSAGSGVVDLAGLADPVRGEPVGLVDLVDLVDLVRASALDVRTNGLEVRVHVAEAAGRSLAAHLAAPVADALGHALRECLENARRHSGVRAADVTVVVDGDRVSVVVLDEGRGFDPGAVPPDRLGLRDSVAGRLLDVGGSSTVWSGPGLGTSVLLSAPRVEGPAVGTELEEVSTS